MRATSLLTRLLLCSPLAADETFVPFVIPATPHADSLIAFPYQPAFDVGSERVVARDGRFHRGSSRYRVWGVNLCFGACLPTHADAERVAERLARAGINSVRFHHMDMQAFPRGIWDPKDPTKLSAEALDRLDYFLSALAKRGLCADLNLHVSRTHSRHLELPNPGTKNDKIVGIFTPRLIDAQQRYARDLLTHVNPYRKVAYADDPAVAFVEITNEDSFFMWGAESRLRALPPYYADILRGLYAAWLKGRYAATAGLREAWGKGLGRHESLEDGTVALFGAADSQARKIDRMRFCAETEKAYFDAMRRFVRTDLGCEALVTGTIVFGPLGLWAQSDMDFIDTHAYWHHPRFPGRPWDPANWTIQQESMADDWQKATLYGLAASRLAGKPFTVSEYNHPAPSDYQAETVPMIASFGAAQDWDGVWLFAYCHRTDDWDRKHFTGFFDIDANPAKWGFVPAGTVIFRETALGPLAR